MMGGGLKTCIITHTIFMGNLCYVLVLPYSNRDICQDAKKHSETPTISRLDDQINITVKIETDEFYVLKHNGSITSTTSHKSSNVNINTTHFTLITSCASATGSYILQTAGAYHHSTCHYFNVSCPSYFTPPSYSTPTHLEQSSCSECTRAIFTIAPFVIVVSYLIF
nr:membrane glycoprotein E51 [Elephant endotheliotropic herpesvirus 1A]